jgi:hypothetical protein
VTIGLVLAVVGVAAAVGLAKVRINTTASAFLPAGDPALTSMTDSAQAFGGDPIVILAESAKPHELMQGDQLGRLLGLEGKLAKLPDVAVVYGPGTLLNQIARSAHDLMATIFGRRDGVRAMAEGGSRAGGAPPDQVKAAGDAAVSDYDARYGSLVLQAMPAGLPTLHNQGFVDTVVFDSSGNPRPEWHFLVPSPTSVAILVRPREDLDQAGTARLVESARAVVAQSGLATSRITVSGTPTVFADLGHTVQREIPLLGGVALALIIACYLGIPWLRNRPRRLIPLAATLSSTLITLALFGWLGIRLSLGAIAFLPILIGIGSDFPAYVVHGVPRRRVIVSATASAAGFGSLALSSLPFVRDLGLALGFGVLMAVAVTFLIRRFLLSMEPEEAPVSTDAEPVRTVMAAPRRTLILGALALVATLGWLVLPRLDVLAQPEQLAAGLPAVTDAQRAEQVVGTSGEVDVLLRGAHLRSPEALNWMRQAEDTIVRRYGSTVRIAVSLPDLLGFLGPNPSPEQFEAGLQLLPHYLVAAVLNDDGSRAEISLGISLQDLRDQQQLLTGLRSALPPTPPGMSAEVVGLPMAAARGYQLVSENRYLSNIVGILAAGLVLLVGLSRRTDALRALLAALLATGWGLAGAYLLHIQLSPLSVALGSLTTATACEFTVLLAYASERGRRAVRTTVAVAALAAALGYLALAVSSLAILVQFGLLLAATVGLSLAAATAVVRLLPPRPERSMARPPSPEVVKREATV